MSVGWRFLIVPAAFFCIVLSSSGQVVDEGVAKGRVELIPAPESKLPVPYIHVAAISDHEFNRAQQDPKRARAWRSVQTFDKGHYSCQELQFGVWHFYAFYHGYDGGLAEARILTNENLTASPDPIELKRIVQVSPSNSTSSQHIKLVLYKMHGNRSQGTSNVFTALQGTVVDERGEPIPSSVVSIYAQQNDTVIRAIYTLTDAQGGYTLKVKDLPVSPEYLLTVAKYGYQSEVVIVSDWTSPRLNPNFKLSLESDFGEITSEAPADASRRRVFTAAVGRTLEALPLSGSRSLDSVALTSPGILPPPETRDNAGPSFSPGIGTAGAFAANGLRGREVAFAVDGGDNNDELVGTRRQGFLFSSSLPPEAIQEFQVVSAFPDGRLGRGTSAQITVISKPGLGDFHASLYNFFTNDSLKAKDFYEATGASLPGRFPALRPSDGTPVFVDGQQLFIDNPAATKPEWKRMQSGVMVATPVREVYVSGGIEGLVQRGKKETHFSVPTVDERRLSPLVLAQLPDGSLPVTVPGDAVFSFFPFPNNPNGPFGPNTFTEALPIDGTGARWFARVDQRGQQGPDLGFHGGAKYSHSIESATLPSSGGAIGSMLRSRIQNVDFAMYGGFESLTGGAHNFRMGAGFTLANLAPRSPSTALPDTPLLLDVTPVKGGLVSQDEKYVSATSPSGLALLSGLGYSGVTSAGDVLGPFGQLDVAGFSPFGIDPFFFPQHRSDGTAQFAYGGSIVRGNRIYLFGVDYRIRQIATVNQPNQHPLITFSGLTTRFPGSTSSVDAYPAALAAAGLPTGVFQTFVDFRTGYKLQDDRGLRSHQTSLYFQHERSIRSNVSLTAGLRLAINGIADYYKTPLTGLFDRAQLLSDAAAAEAACNPSCPGFVASIAQAFPSDYPSLTVTPVTFAPRVGIAWSPGGHRNWSVRAGYGVYSGVVPGFAANELRQGFNRFVPLNLANSPLFTSQGEFLLNLANPLVRQLRPDLNIVPSTAVNFSEISVNPLLLLTSTLTNLSAFGAPPTFSALPLLRAQQSLANPYSEHYTLTIERALKRADLSVAYVGTRGINLLRAETPQGGTLRSSMTLNQIGTAAGGFPTISATSMPAQGTLAGGIVAIAPTVYSSSASSTFNSFQAEFRGRLGGGVLLNSAYTYSHAIDDVSDFFDLSGAFALPQNSAMPSERASSNFDVRHRLAGSFIWDIAQRQNSRWFGGWQLAGLWTIQSGQPFTVNSTLDVNGDGNLTDRLNTTQGLLIGPLAADSTRLLELAPSVSPRSLLAASGKNGAIGRNTFRSWGIKTADVAVTKTYIFRGSESKRLVFRLETFNLLNHTQFAIPVRILESPSFGKSVQTTIPAKTFQIAVKWLF